MLKRHGITNKHIVAAFFLVGLLAIPLSGSSYYTNIMNVIAIHTMVAVGLCLLMGYTGQVSLGHAAFYGLGAFVSGVLSTVYGVPPLLALAIAAVATAFIAYVIAFPIFKLKGNYLAMATLGLGISFYVVFREYIRSTRASSAGLSGIPSLGIGGFEINNDFKFYYLAWAVCLAILFISRNIVNSRSGRALRAIHGNEDAAMSLGIDVDKFKTKVFVLSAVYAAVAGSLYAHMSSYISAQPFDFMFSVKLVVMVVVGGLASIWGAIFGTAVISLLSQALHGVGDLDIIAFGLILMVVMIFMPQGLTRGVVEMYESGRLRAVWRKVATEWARH